MKYSTSMLPTLVLLMAGIVITSCKDDEPPVPAQLSFAETTLTATESDGEISIDLVLDKAASEDVTIDYTLSGTAADKVTDANNYDYVVTSSYLSVDIAKGETTGTITIDPSSDLDFEVVDETIIIKIDKVSSTGVTITREDELTITLKQEDGMAIVLTWPDPITGGAQADMDIILRVGETISTLETDPFTGSATQGVEGPEGIFLPKIITIPAYGVSYTYYDGNIDPLEFTVTFADFVNGSFEAEANMQVYTATYTVANINKWTDAKTTLVVQTFEKTDAGFSTPSAISVPALGSRYASPTGGLNASTFKKGNIPSSYKFDPTRLFHK